MKENKQKTIKSILEGFEKRFVVASRAKDGALLVESNVVNVEVMQEYIRKEIEELLDGLIMNKVGRIKENERGLGYNRAVKEFNKKLDEVRGGERE